MENESNCTHAYSRQMNQEYPRLCIKCGESEGYNPSLLIIGVAVRFKDVCYGLPKPNRHSHCFSVARAAGITNPTNRADDQGFYLEDGTFLTRKEAFIHATKTKQIINPEAREYLFSEDLW